MKSCYLYNKNTKKLRSLKQLIDQLDDLVDVTDNFIEMVVWHLPEHVGQNWLGIFVKSLQRAINKFGVYLTDLKIVGKIEIKSKNKGRNFWLCQQMVRLLIPTWDGILFAPIDAVERNFVGLAEEDTYSS